MEDGYVQCVDELVKVYMERHGSVEALERVVGGGEEEEGGGKKGGDDGEEVKELRVRLEKAMKVRKDGAKRRKAGRRLSSDITNKHLLLVTSLRTLRSSPFAPRPSLLALRSSPSSPTTHR